VIRADSIAMRKGSGCGFRPSEKRSRVILLLPLPSLDSYGKSLRILFNPLLEMRA